MDEEVRARSRAGGSGIYTLGRKQEHRVASCDFRRQFDWHMSSLFGVLFKFSDIDCTFEVFELQS
jgi:hypothetical protein